MFDWVLNMPLKTTTIFFPDVSKLKLMNFWNFFQWLTFPTNTCQRLRRIWNPVEHSKMDHFREIFLFFAKFTRKTLCWSLILIKLQVSILQLHWKKELQHRCFLMNFARHLRHLFYRTPPAGYFCSTEKIFYQ